ncbi:MAG TPA: N-formylglutamate amidohydrolase [Rudaea sp.]|jgi:predicted N-formylglutamate amidohydrolase|uniref:N-formylglutamate amidohydrolase n=1 Tax=Rudaea sp. TaxID=2136325 RepID=UPI002F9284B7
MANDTVKLTLLAPDEPPAFSVTRAEAASPFLLICDHAGQRIPRALGDLGVAASELQRHIAWDIGALGVAAQLSHLLDACLIAQTYSRLVIDCNRPLDAAGSIVTRSERTDVLGNRDLAPAAAAARVREIFAPYHARIAAELDRRLTAGLLTILVSVHSFTPEFMDTARPWHLGMLYNRDARVAHALLAMIRAEGQWIVGDNEPYAVSDVTDYAIPVHGEARGLPHLELEIRQDLIADAQGQAEWAMRVAAWLERVPAMLGL